MERPTNRSFIIDEQDWKRAKLRADGEGVTMSSVIRDLVIGYAEGHYDLPRHVTQAVYPS